MNSSIAGMLQSWKGSTTAFLIWWRDELWGLVPEYIRVRLTSSETGIVVATSPVGMQVLEAVGGRTRPASPILPPTEAVAAAARIKRERSAEHLGVRIPMQSCFKRSVELPLAARTDAGRILDLDLERSTPFKLKDVYTAAYVDDASRAAGKIKAVQLIAKRQSIDPVLEELRGAGLSVDFVDCWDEDGRSALPLNFLAVRGTPTRDFSRLVSAPRLLAVCSALLLVTAIGLMLSRHLSALEEVQGRVAATRARAATVRNALEISNAAVAELTRLQRHKFAQNHSITIIEELSKLLPDSVWVADLRLEGDALDISGLAKSGSALLPLFERSKLFAEAALTAPLTFDQQEDKERFSLRARVRQPNGEARTNPEGQQ